MAETYTFEDRTYLDPTVSRDEQLGFIDRLREIENKDLQKIATDTHNLGSDLPSNLGGLSGLNPNTGSAGIWKNRFERPQTNALVSGLKASAQAAALNTALNNVFNQYKHRYNEAYRNAQKAVNGTSEDPFKTQIGDDYQEAQMMGAIPEGWDGGQLYVADKDGTIHSLINVTVDSNGNIGSVDTPMMSYVGPDVYDGKNPAKDYITSLINDGYVFLTPDKKNIVKINPGE